MNLELIPAEARELLPAFIRYINTTNWAEPKPPQLSLEEAGDWDAETWAHFLNWMSSRGQREDLVEPTLMAVKPHIVTIYEDLDHFRDFLEGGEDGWCYTEEHLTLVTNVENVVNFILFHCWHDERIKPQVIALVKKFPPTPTQWIKAFENTSFSERWDEPIAQLIAAHWEATEASFVEWNQAVHLLNDVNGESLNPAVDPEIVLLREIAIDKMRAIVRADHTFNDPITP